MENQKQIDRLRSIINDPSKTDKVRQQAQTQLDRLTAIGGVQMASVQSGAVVDPTAQTILDAITNALNKGVTSATDIKREIEEVLRYRKINESDLSDSLRAYISSTKKIEITIFLKLFSIFILVISKYHSFFKLRYKK